MALFKRKKEDQDLKKQQEMQQKLAQEKKLQILSPFEVHVMPQKFMGELQSAAQASGKKSRVGVVLAIVVVIVALLGVGAWQLYLALNPSEPQAPLANNQPVNNVATNNAPTTNEPVNNIPVNNEPVNNVSANNVATNNAPANNAPVNNAPLTNQPSAAKQSSLDVDRDGLTDVEEDLYGTQLRLPDTDGDGFTDGQEMLSGYSPLTSGATRLADTALVNTYLNNTFGFSLLYPSSWLARPADQSNQEILFTSSTGEVMRFEVMDNPDKLSLTQWMIANQAANPNEYTDFRTRGNLQAMISQNQLNYYIDEPVSGKVYVVTYQPNNVIRVNFLTTLRAMINSLATRQ